MRKGKIIWDLGNGEKVWRQLTISDDAFMIQDSLEKRKNAMPINVNLTPQLEEMVKKKVASGRYNSASEVIGEALRLMEEQDRVRAARLERLRQDIQDGLNSGAPTPWDPEEIKREGRNQRR